MSGDGDGLQASIIDGPVETNGRSAEAQLRGNTLTTDYGLYSSSAVTMSRTGLGDEEWVVTVVPDDHCWSFLVLHEQNYVRIAWSTIVICLLAYTATVYLYRFSFCIFHIGPDGADPIGESDLGWRVLDVIVDIFFWIDLVANFFFSYKNERGIEVDSMRLIARKYMAGLFWVNALACTPEEVGSALVSSLMSEESADDRVNFRVARLTRLQRISRLTRLMRLTRLAKWAHSRSSSPLWIWFQSLRGVRIVNFISGLVWTVHFLACGWYICAAMHEDVTQTWVARRAVNASGETSLLEAPPFEQWLHSMYFVLTVFTTVGFGDMSAVTEAEIIYVAMTMVVGAVVHSIIISEVISLITSSDRFQEFIDKQYALIDAYSEHAHLSADLQQHMKNEVKFRARTMVLGTFDQGEMRDLLLTDRYLPRWLLAELPENMFEGRLVKNRFLCVCKGVSQLPPRLACLMSIHLHRVEFEAGEVIYKMYDFPFNLFLVLSGTFAHVATPTRRGGVDDALPPPPPPPPRTPSQSALTQDGSNSQAQKQQNPSMRYAFTSGMRKAVKAAKSRSSFSATAAQSGSALSTAAGRLYPYRLVSRGNYFGDVEALKGCTRFSTVRCETQAGVALMLHKQDFDMLQAEYPQFDTAWHSAASNRDWCRVKQLARLTRGMNYRHLAATNVQRWYRELRVARSRQRDEPPRDEHVKAEGDPVQVDISTASAIHTLRAQTVRRTRRNQAFRSSVNEEVKEIKQRVDTISSDINLLRSEMRSGMEALQKALGNGGGTPVRM